MALRVQDIMTDRVETVRPGTPAEEAWQLMRANRIHHLVVTNKDGVAGVVSERDIGGPRGARLRRDQTVEALMTPHPVTVEPTIPVRRAANMMRGRAIGCLVVTQKKRVVGIVTVSDLLGLLGRGVERPVVDAKRWTLRHSTPHTKKPRPTGLW